MNALVIYTVPELMVSAINDVKMIAGGHALHERHAILLAMVIFPIYRGEHSYFCSYAFCPYCARRNMHAGLLEPFTYVPVYLFCSIAPCITGPS